MKKMRLLGVSFTRRNCPNFLYESYFLFYESRGTRNGLTQTISVYF